MADEMLSDYEKLYQSLAEKSFAGIFFLQDGKFKYVNSNAASYVGYKPSELIGKRSLDFVHPDDREAVSAYARAMLRGERAAPYEYRTLSMDGQIRWVMETVSPVTVGGMPTIMGNLISTSWTMSRVDLEIVQAIIESVNDGVYIVDRDGYYITANEGFERITGIKRSDIVGKHTTYLVERGWIARPVNLQVLKDQQNRTRLVRYPSGKNTLVSAAIVWDKNRVPIGAVSSLRDLTELNEIQSQLTRSADLIQEYKKKIDLLEKKLTSDNHGFIGMSKESQRVLTVAEKIADSDVTVLIRGESGVGKEIIARFIHEHSGRRKTGAFVKIDCAALPASLIDSELFGYERGAFTDAKKEGKPGLFEMADKGTLFLDEIGELPYDLQSKLLSAIQDRAIKRIGGLLKHFVDVRIIVATNLDLEEMVLEKKFRHDLFYRLNVIPIHIPPLRDRKEDILPLINYYLDDFNKRYRTNKYIHKEALNLLTIYDWPGNVRELKNSIERLILMTTGDEIQLPDIADEMKIFHNVGASLFRPEIKALNRVGSLKTNVELFEKDLIGRALDLHENLAATAKDLEIDISTLTRKKQRYKLTKKRQKDMQ
jgi:PAS domain S-box-containing protein